MSALLGLASTTDCLDAGKLRRSLAPSFCIRSLDALKRIDPLFGKWNVLDRQAQASVPLAVARPRITTIRSWTCRQLSHFRLRTHDRASLRLLGTTSSATMRTSPTRIAGTLQSRLPARAAARAQWASTSPRAGSWAAMHSCGLAATRWAILTYPLFRAALLTINTFWSPAWACAHVFKMRFHIPWIAYVSAPLASRLQLPAEIATERTPDGGLLMTATNEPLDPTNPEHLRRARILAEILIARAGAP
jgi:hypothetical protein